MPQLTLQGVLGADVVIDVCRRCRAFWFDPYETLQLTPPATIRLFQLMAEGATGAAPFPAESHCPKCRSRLLLTHDRQRNTPFVYWRCDQGHGRFTPFVEFLKEKDFVRQPTPQQLAELRRTIGVIRCSGCGAPVDLAREAVCGHCGAAISMLDVKRLGELAPKGTSAPPPVTLKPPAFAQSHVKKPATLIDLGLETVMEWLGELIF